MPLEVFAVLRFFVAEDGISSPHSNGGGFLISLLDPLLLAKKQSGVAHLSAHYFFVTTTSVLTCAICPLVQRQWLSCADETGREMICFDGCASLASRHHRKHAREILEPLLSGLVEKASHLGAHRRHADTVFACVLVNRRSFCQFRGEARLRRSQVEKQA